MKIKLLHFSIFLLPIAIIFVSCAKPDKSSIDVGVGIISATINKQHCNFKITDVEYQVSGNTVTVSVFGINTADSTQSIAFYFYQVAGFTNNKYDCVNNYPVDSITATYINGPNILFCDGIDSYGYFNIVSYIPQNGLKGSFNLNFYNPNDSTTTNASGEFNTSFYGNANDLPIPVGEMESNIGNSVVYFNAIGARQIMGEDTNYNITATAGQKDIILQFVNFMPKPGETYKIGYTYFSNNPNDYNAYIAATYVQDTSNTFIADSGSFNVVKAGFSNIQAKFQFVGYNRTNPALNVTITNGMFNAIIAYNYSKKLRKVTRHLY